MLKRKVQFAGLLAVLAALALIGQGRADDLDRRLLEKAQPTRSEAEAKIRALQKSILNATEAITIRNLGIFAANGTIAAAEVALADEQTKQNPDPQKVLALRIGVAFAKATKDDLVREKQEWEQFRREQEKTLAQWEEYLRQQGP